MKILNVLFLIFFSASAFAAEATTDTTLPDMLQPIMPAVVHIEARGELSPAAMLQQQQRPGKGQPQPPQPPAQPGVPQAPQQFESFGSGVIVDAGKGYILTNSHVIKEAKTITVTLNDGRKFIAKVVGADPSADIALLQITNTGGTKLIALPMGDSDKLKVGEFVAAIGTPFGLNQTVTTGIVSGLQRTKLGIEEYENFIQTNASINPGNSGGALVNRQGQLVGINTAIISPEGGNIGIGFAIPINMARSLMGQIIQFGNVQRGLLGVMLQDFTPDVADAMKLSNQKGSIISLVTPGSPAERAGIKVGDIIQKVNGQPVIDAGEVRNTVGLLRVGSRVSLELLRDGKPVSVSLSTMEPKVYEKDNIVKNPFLYGAGFRAFEEMTAGLVTIKGVMLLQTNQEGAIWRAGLRPGDVILSANGVPVTTLDGLLEATKKNKDLLLLNVFRGGGAMYVVVK